MRLSLYVVLGLGALALLVVLLAWVAERRLDQQASSCLTGDPSRLADTDVALVLGAALSWAAGNTVQRALKPADMLAFVVWSSLFAAPALFALAIGVEGWDAVAGGIIHADAMTWGAVAFQSFGNFNESGLIHW